MCISQIIDSLNMDSGGGGDHPWGVKRLSEFKNLLFFLHHRNVHLSHLCRRSSDKSKFLSFLRLNLSGILCIQTMILHRVWNNLVLIYFFFFFAIFWKRNIILLNILIIINIIKYVWKKTCRQPSRIIGAVLHFKCHMFKGHYKKVSMTTFNTYNLFVYLAFNKKNLLNIEKFFKVILGS
jgi:hypothetical protein